MWATFRAIVARRDGYRCFYCKVPTAATIEHVSALVNDGRSNLENLRIACCWCNSVKGDESVESFIAREGWKMPLPSDLAADVPEMLRQEFGWDGAGETVWTASTNARLKLEDGVALVQVRPSKREPWTTMGLGPIAHPKVVRAAFEFMRRHNTRWIAKR